MKLDPQRTSKMKSIAAMVLPMLLIACGSADPTVLISEGQKAIGSGDFEAARSKFSAALESLNAGDPQFLDASLGLVESLITTDAAKASEKFLALAHSCPDLVGEKEYNYIGGQMISAHKYLEALSLLSTGIPRFGGESSILMMQVDRIKKAATNAVLMRQLSSSCPGYPD